MYNTILHSIGRVELSTHCLWGKQVKLHSKMLNLIHLTQMPYCFTTNNVPDMASPHLLLQCTWKHKDTSHGFNYALHVVNQVICAKTVKQTKADTSKLPWLLGKHNVYSSISISTIQYVGEVDGCHMAVEILVVSTG